MSLPMLTSWLRDMTAGAVDVGRGAVLRRYRQHAGRGWRVEQAARPGQITLIRPRRGRFARPDIIIDTVAVKRPIFSWTETHWMLTGSPSHTTVQFTDGTVGRYPVAVTVIADALDEAARRREDVKPPVVKVRVGDRDITDLTGEIRSMTDPRWAGLTRG